MKKLMTVFLIVGVSLNAFAAAKLRVPVLVEGYNSQTKSMQMFRIADLSEALKAKNLKVPKRITIAKDGDFNKLNEIGYKFFRTRFSVPGTETIASVVSSTRLSKFYSDGKDGVCYIVDAKKTARENAQEAYELLTNIPYGILDEDYWVVATRHSDENSFNDDDITGEYSAVELNELFAGKKLREGEIQIIASTKATGKHAFEDILGPCLKK